MSFINYSQRELNFKLVYYGPGLVGKTTNLEWIYRNLGKPSGTERMTSLATETERALFFDVAAPKLGPLRGLRPRFHLYTVPGPVFYDASRRLILRGVDGVVFVCDSQVERMEANHDSLENLETLLEVNERALIELPHVLQYNKRDLPSAVPLATMRSEFNGYDAPEFAAVARRGEGVRETFEAITEAVLEHAKRTLEHHDA